MIINERNVIFILLFVFKTLHISIVQLIKKVKNSIKHDING